jgi:hypothetical protein
VETVFARALQWRSVPIGEGAGVHAVVGAKCPKTDERDERSCLVVGAEPSEVEGKEPAMVSTVRSTGTSSGGAYGVPRALSGVS